MVSADSWSKRAVQAFFAEQKRHPDPTVGPCIARISDDRRFEITFAPSYLSGREVTLVVDGSRPFAPGFVLDAGSEMGRPADQYPIDDVAWRIYLLGMREPFAIEDLELNRAGEGLRFFTERG